jgi:hypothetical protein
MTQGKWVVNMPQDMEGGQKSDLQYTSLSEIFDRATDSVLYREYAEYIEKTLQQQRNRSFGALILEPVILGAGGMVFASVLNTLEGLTNSAQRPPIPTGLGRHRPEVASSRPRDIRRSVYRNIPPRPFQLQRPDRSKSRHRRQRQAAHWRSRSAVHDIREPGDIRSLHR